MAKRKKVRLTKLSKKIIGCTFLLLLLYFLATFPFAMELKGDKRITIEVFSEYEELGIIQKFGSKYKTIGEVDTTKLGKYTIKYRWLSETLTRTVYVVDNTSPEITLNDGTDEYVQLNTEYTDPGVTAIDNYDGDITANVTIKSKVNTAKIGDYEVKYSVVDSSDNKTTVTKIVHVLDDDFTYQENIYKDSDVEDNVINTIVNLKNNYYLNMKYLIDKRCDDLFSDDEYQYLYYKLTDISVQMHKDVPIDLSINDVKYDLTINEYEETDDGYYIDLTEKYEIIYNYNLNNVNISEVECVYYLDSDYKITQFERVEGCFYSILDDYESPEDWQSYVDEITTEYYEKHKANIDSFLSDLEKINNSLLSKDDVISIGADYSYNRAKAVQYAQKYVFDTNDDYFYIRYNNCVNFVSQCLHAGGLPMISEGDNQWKNYNYDPNYEDGEYGFTYSWTATGYFMDFLKRSNDIIVQTHITPFLAEEGDVMMFGSSQSNLSHATIISEVVKDDKGNIIDILFCGNTNNALNLSLLANTSIYYECEKVIGYN